MLLYFSFFGYYLKGSVCRYLSNCSHAVYLILNLCAEIISYRCDKKANHKLVAETKLSVHTVKKNSPNLKGTVLRLNLCLII